ncbi:hypothetical protein Ddye_018912 [Dipteronia dyeriana]|uniref:CCHC-type domain-containing protein n=1 Tax=Dipteronia dyeriana TaxID=168575 RepID=A0AAD9TX50_9ROSI|nr:hypothetical protein Ddye_018912 [Dipteronia dyeriana]
MPVWVRVSKLPMEWVDVNLLWKIGGCWALPLKSILSKPLKSNVYVEDRAIKVEYESMGLICFNCGRVGHSKEFCKKGIVEQNEDINQSEKDSRGSGNESEPYGPWMQVDVAGSSNFEDVALISKRQWRWQ